MNTHDKLKFFKSLECPTINIISLNSLNFRKSDWKNLKIFPIFSLNFEYAKIVYSDDQKTEE